MIYFELGLLQIKLLKSSNESVKNVSEEQESKLETLMGKLKRVGLFILFLRSLEGLFLTLNLIFLCSMTAH